MNQVAKSDVGDTDLEAYSSDDEAAAKTELDSDDDDRSAHSAQWPNW